MKISKNLIEDQLRILECQLPKMIDSDYVYLDFPGHFNVGDILISVGAFELLKRVPFKCLYKSNSIFSRFFKNSRKCCYITTRRR